MWKGCHISVFLIHFSIQASPSNPFLDPYKPSYVVSVIQLLNRPTTEDNESKWVLYNHRLFYGSMLLYTVSVTGADYALS